MARFELIATAVSMSSKEDGGEDRIRTIGRGGGPVGVIVCDGVGSVAGSGAVAEEACELGAALVSGMEVEPAIWGLDRRLVADLPVEGEGKTTMALVCAEENGVIGHLLLGNGSIVEVVPVEVQPGKVRLLWTSVALPQIGSNAGKPALRSFLPPENGVVEAEKGVRRATVGMPRLYLACSDGFLSEEDRSDGTAPDGTKWRRVPELAAGLMQLLTDAWNDLPAEEPEAAAETLRALIKRSIEGPNPERPLDDDTTVGALYMRPAAMAGGEAETEG